MTNTQRHAQRELDILVKSVKDCSIKDFVPEILNLAEKFGLSGQSGGSAPFVATALAQVIKKVLLQEPVCDITGIDDEWGTVADAVRQNNRCSAIFREKDGKPYYLDAITWKTQNGGTWSGVAIMKDGSNIYSRQYIKKFPFKPKTFYIDVIEQETKPDDWDFFIKDERQLSRVFKYYDRWTK